MRLAWAASLLAQGWLAWSLWQYDKRDWWLVFLTADLFRSFLLWPLTPDQYWWGWMLTEPIMLVLKFTAVWQVVGSTKEPSWIFTGIWASFFLCAILLSQSPETWPLAKRTTLLMLQLGVFLPLGILIGGLLGKALLNQCLLCYLLLDAVRALVEPFIHTKQTFEDLNTLYLWSSAVLLASFAYKYSGLSRRRLNG